MDDLPGVRVQLLHGPVQGQPALPLLRLLRWIVGGGLTGQVLLLQGNVPLPPLQLLVPQPLGDGAQPYLRRAVPAEGAQLSEGLAEGLLAQLLRQVSVPAQGEEIAVHQLGVLFIQVFTPVGHGGRLLPCPSVYWSQGRDIRYRI